jgi:hypothetical protein
MNNNYDMNNNYNGNSGYGQNNMNNVQPSFNNAFSSKCKVTLNRKKSFVASLVAFKIYVDDIEVGKIKNGGTLVFEVTPGQHVFSINKASPINLIINADISADVVVYGANNFGFDNIGGVSLNTVNENINKNYSEKCKSQANGTLVASLLLPVISIILYFTTKEYLINSMFYGVIIGLACINIFGLKHLKSSDAKLYKTLLIKNIIAVLVSVIAAGVTIPFII